jgi:hypothetical protein
LKPREILAHISKPTLLWFVAIATLVAHASLFGSWIVDDAGIVFAYARNLAEGKGLVAQAGLIPVEGYSDFSWVLLLSPFFLLNLFDPVWTPKLASFFLTLVSFGFLHRSFHRHANRGPYAAPCVALLLSLNTSFVVWTFSGLENSLFVCLLVVYLFLCCEVGLGVDASRRKSILAGCVIALVAMTRPDGIAYLPAFPFLYLAMRRGGRWTPSRDDLMRLLSFGLGFLSFFGSFITFRVLYFGQWVPNTYFAKGGPSFGTLFKVVLLDPEMISKGIGLISSMAGLGGGLLLLSVIGGTCYLVGRGGFSRVHAAWLVFLLFSILSYLLLPYDWMTEYRFATPFFLFFYGYCVLIGIELIDRLGARPDSAERIMKWAMVGAVSLGVVVFSDHSASFAAHPTTSFANVSRRFAFLYDDYAERLQVAEGSILLPDVGGPLYYSKLRIYDLGGLVDPHIARTLVKDPAALHNYIFAKAKPTFIHTHASWTVRSRLDMDPRFHEDYVPLNESLDEYAAKKYQLKIFSGDYVRREVAEAHPEVIRQIRAELEYQPEKRLGRPISRGGTS